MAATTNIHSIVAVKIGTCHYVVEVHFAQVEVLVLARELAEPVPGAGVRPVDVVIEAHGPAGVQLLGRKDVALDALRTRQREIRSK